MLYNVTEDHYIAHCTATSQLEHQVHEQIVTRQLAQDEMPDNGWQTLAKLFPPPLSVDNPS